MLTDWPTLLTCCYDPASLVKALLVGQGAKGLQVSAAAADRRCWWQQLRVAPAPVSTARTLLLLNDTDDRGSVPAKGAGEDSLGQPRPGALARPEELT